MTAPIDPSEPLPSEIRRIAAAETSAAVAALEKARTEPGDGFHGCRKAIKRLRALWRLVRAGDEPYCRAQDASLRRTAKLLAGPREATALVETADRLAETAKGDTEAKAVAALRAILEARRSTLMGSGLHVGPVIAEATASFSKLDFTSMRMPDLSATAADVLEIGARKGMRRALKALKAARETGEAEAFHDLRKAVKALSLQGRLLKPLRPDIGKRDLKAMEAFGERLGDLNDLHVIDALLSAEGAALVGDDATAMLRELVDSNMRKLKRRCLKEAGKLLEREPAPIARKLATRYVRKAGKAQDPLAA